MTRRKLHKAVESLDIRKKNQEYLIPGILGFLINGVQTVEVSGRNGYVYVRLRNNLNEVVQAYNDQVSPIYNLPVLIVRDEVDITRYKVQGRDLGVYQNWGTGGAYTPVHGNQHSFNPEGGGGGDVVWVYSRQFMPLLLHPSGSVASPYLMVEPYTFYDGSDWKYVGKTGTTDLTVYKPTGSNARMVLVFIDQYGNPNYEPGSLYFNATITGTAEVNPYIPDPPTGTAIPIGAVRLVSGTFALDWSNIYDLRPFFGLSGTALGIGGAGGGGAPTDAQYVTMALNGTLTDERVLTAGADITISDGGANGNATVSVTTNTFASGTHTHPAGSTSIQIYEDSVFEVSGTLINFEDQLTVEVTGTTAHIGINQGAGSGLDADTLDGYHNTAFASGTHTHPAGESAIQVYDDGVFVATGTVIDFTTNLNVVATGTVAFVSSSAGGGTELGWFNVEDYGAVHDGVTDDTTAIQDTIDAAEAAGGGVVYFPRGIYIVGGALQDASRSNAQLLLPIRHTANDEPITIHLLGESPPPQIPSLLGTVVTPDVGSIIKGTLNTGAGGALIGAWGPSGSFDNISMVGIKIENLTIQMPTNPVLSALNFGKIAAAEIINVMVNTGSYDIPNITEPTTSTSYGVITPKINNGAWTYIRGLNVIGFYYGVEINEHTGADQIQFWACKYAGSILAANHASHIGRILVVWCENGLKFSGGANYLDILQYDVEHYSESPTKWFDPIYDIDDSNNYANGLIRWHSVLSGTGPENVFDINGGTNLQTIRITEEWGGAATDEKAKVSANDTTAGYLNGKLVAGTRITLTENSDGGNETLSVIVNSHYELLQDEDGNPIWDESLEYLYTEVNDA